MATPYVLCFCGKSIGDVYDWYHATAKSMHLDLEGDIDPNQIESIIETKPEYGKIFEKIGINLNCCKVRLMRQVLFYNVY